MLWGWRPRSLNPKGSQITVSPSPVDHRRGINASPHRRIRVPEGNLQYEFVVHNLIKIKHLCILQQTKKERKNSWTRTERFAK